MSLARRYDHEELIAELQAEVAWLRAELGYRDERIPTIGRVLGLTQQQAHIVSILYGGRGRWVLRTVIDDEVRIEALVGKRSNGAVDTQVCKIRRKLGFDAIRSDGSGTLAALCLSRALVAKLDLVFSP